MNSGTCRCIFPSAPTGAFHNGTVLPPNIQLGDSEIPSSKHQITNKSQIPISNDQNAFCILVIVICLLFEICDLEFLVTLALHYSSILPHDGKDH